MATIITRAGKGSPLTNNEVDANFVNLNTALNPLRQAVRVAMTAAASGSNGISALNSTTYDLGTSNATFHWRGSIAASTTTTEAHRVVGKYQDLNNRWQIAYTPSTRTLAFQANKAAVVVVLASVVLPVALPFDTVFDYSVVLTRETASAAGSVVFYINGVSVGTVAIIAAATVDISNTGVLNISGNTVAGLLRLPTDTYNAIIYNRALSAAEVLSLCVNGPALADLGASQVPVYTSNFSAGLDNWSAAGGVGTAANVGNIDTNADGAGVPPSNDWQRSLRSGSAGTLAFYGNNAAIRAPTTALGKRVFAEADVFIPLGSGVTHVTLMFEGAGTSLFSVSSVTAGQVNKITLEGVLLTPGASGYTPFIYGANVNGSASSQPDGSAIYLKNFTWKYLGITMQLNAENAQSNTGQIFDSSGNKNHALLPAAGATIIGRPTAQPQQVRWTNTWAGTNELQYIGGVNQNILPANAYIDSIVGTVSGATPHDIIVGDGTDADRYVTITTGLAAGTTTFTLANRTTDGTNLKLTVDPDTNATMSIAWTITYRTLE